MTKSVAASFRGLNWVNSGTSEGSQFVDVSRSSQALTRSPLNQLRPDFTIFVIPLPHPPSTLPLLFFHPALQSAYRTHASILSLYHPLILKLTHQHKTDSLILGFYTYICIGTDFVKYPTVVAVVHCRCFHKSQDSLRPSAFQVLFSLIEFLFYIPRFKLSEMF